MSILNIQVNELGQSGVVPRIVRIQTNDSIATVTSDGYINKAQQQGLVEFRESDLCAVVTKESASAKEQVGWYEVSETNGVWSLVPPGAPGDVDLPTVANRLSHFTNTTGTLSSETANVTHDGNLTVSNGDVVVTTGILDVQAGSASIGNDLVVEDDMTSNNGDLQITNGSIRVGQGGTGGFIQSYSNGLTGILTFQAVDNAGGNFGTVVNTDANYVQNQTITIPDAEAATANFLLDAGPNNLIAYSDFIGIPDIILTTAGTWTPTRVAQGNYYLRHTPADDTSIIAIDVTPWLREAAGKGCRLEGFECIYSIGVAALDAHSVTLDRISYTDQLPVQVQSIPLTGSLNTATNANPYVTDITVTTPAFDNFANSKYVIEVTVDAALTSEYDFGGIVLNFTQTIA